MGLIDDLFWYSSHRVTVGELHAVIDSLEIFINWQGRVDQLVFSDF